MTIGYGDEATHGLGVHCPLPWAGFIIPGVHLRTSPGCVAVGHRAALRPPEALPFRRLAAPVEVEAAIPQKGHKIGFDGFAGHRVVDDQTQVGSVAPHGGDSP